MMIFPFLAVPLLAPAMAFHFPGSPPPDRNIRAQIEANIGPTGLRTSTQNYGAHPIVPGVIIAAPYPEDTYNYTWTRDAALTIHYLVQLLEEDPGFDHQMIIEDYRSLQPILMGLKTKNPNSDLPFTFETGGNLGEPKFNLDGTTFWGQWGRPQGDGPPSRAIALMRYAQWALDKGMKDYIRHYHWPIIRNDLDYVAQYWSTPMYDLWEEVHGHSFYTRMVQYKALLFGLNMAAELGVDPENTHVRNWAEVAPYIKCSLKDFWNVDNTFIAANLVDFNLARTGLAMDTVLASTHTFDPALGCDSWLFQPCSDTAIRNFHRVEEEFRYQAGYGINKDKPPNAPVHLGRYKEDWYYGGNPWYLLTLGASEFLYDALISWELNGWVDITDISLPFFHLHVDDKLTPGRYFKSKDESVRGVYEDIFVKIRDYAFDYLDLANSQIPEDGGINEQYHRDTGKPHSVKHLTWSYTAYGSARDRAWGKTDRSWFTGHAAMSNFHARLEPGACGAKLTKKGDYNWDNAEFGFAPIVPHGMDPKRPMGSDPLVPGPAADGTNPNGAKEARQAAANKRTQLEDEEAVEEEEEEEVEEEEEEETVEPSMNATSISLLKTTATATLTSVVYVTSCTVIPSTVTTPPPEETEPPSVPDSGGAGGRLGASAAALAILGSVVALLM